MTIFIDVLLVINLYINYFLIRGTAIIMRFDISAKRCILSSAIGAALSFVILMPELPFWLTALIKILSGALIVFTAFGFHSRQDYIISSLCFLIISFMYAGLMMGIWFFAAPFGMFYRNGTAYFDIPVITAAALTALAYGIVKFIKYISDRRGNSVITAEITVITDGKIITMTGLSDTGNSLTDPFSGKNVIVCGKDVIAQIIPTAVSSYLDGRYGELQGIRLVPCHTISGELLIPIFTVEKIEIDGKPVNAVIGVCKQPIVGADCVFNPNLISL